MSTIGTRSASRVRVPRRTHHPLPRSPPSFPPRGRFNAGTGPNTLGEKGEAARLVETLVLASAGKSTQNLYLAKWNTWVGERAARGKGPWL